MKNRSSKQALVFLLGFVMICTLCACGGKINDVRVGSVESALYSEKDINAAIRVIVREFDRSWTGCTLTSICYAGDELTGAESE